MEEAMGRERLGLEGVVVKEIKVGLSPGAVHVQFSSVLGLGVRVNGWVGYFR